MKLEILDDNHNGMGYTKYNNVPVFVKGALKGDIVTVEITKKTNKYYLGKITSFIKKMEREKVFCPYYEKCGGCNLLHVSYNEELKKKKEYIERLFKRDIKINSYDRFNYRNKVTLHVEDENIGLYEENTNKLIEIDSCLLLNEDINNVIEIIKSFDLSDIYEITIKDINGILINYTGNIGNNDLKKLIELKKVKSIYNENKLIYGDKYLSINFDNKKYVIDSKSFFQVNTKCALNLYRKIKEYAGSSNSLLDLYCGSLTIGIYLSDNFKSITGIEISKDSYKCGKENIKLNNLKNCNILLGDSSIINAYYDVVIVDPPRTGLSKKVINNLKSMKAKKIVYVSCNPNTLKRDIDLLDNYNLEKQEAFNMFPGTKHIEVVSLLKLKN